MTVEELKKALENIPDDTEVVMCIDWSASEDPESPEGQWEYDLQGIGHYSEHKKVLILINKNFK